MFALKEIFSGFDQQSIILCVTTNIVFAYYKFEIQKVLETDFGNRTGTSVTFGARCSMLLSCIFHAL